MKNIKESVELHNELNPLIWKNDELLPDVESKLLDIVSYFKDYCDIPMSVVDAQLVGSNASFNYNKNSDLDLHLIVNFDIIDASNEILQMAYNNVKASFNSNYDVKIHGIDVEMYIQDIKTSTMSNGIYSLFRKRWIKFPKPIEYKSDYDFSDILQKWEEKKNFAIKSGNSKKIENLINTAYLIRKNSLEVDGEFGQGNLLFKELRNSGILQELKDSLVKAKSNDLSLENLSEAFILDEASRNDLITKSKVSTKGRERFKRRVKSKVANQVKQFNSIDMNKLFKDDILTVNVAVKGETDDYTVKISFGGFLKILRKEVDRTRIFDLRSATRALIEGFNKDDVYIHCSCPDFCLDGSTNIKLLNGEVISVADMLDRFSNGEEMWVYSSDEKGDFKPGKVSDVWISGYVNSLIKVTLDNGKEILTTPNHRYMLRDGSYKEAKDLEIGQSLMPMYFNYHNGYESYKKNSESTTKFYSVYKEVANSLLEKEIEDAKIRSGEDSIAIHHKDFNKLNNYPSNLYPMGRLEHYMWHSNHVKESGALDKFLEGGKKYWATDEAKKKQTECMRNTMKEYYENVDENTKKYLHDVRSKNSKEAWERGCFNTERWKNASNKRKEFLHSEEMERLTTEGIRRYWSNLSDEDRAWRASISRQNSIKGREKIIGIKRSEETKNKLKEAIKNQTPEQKAEHCRKINLSKIRNQLYKLIELGKDLTEDNYASISYAGCPKLHRYFSSIDEAVSYFNINHKVKSIEYVVLDEAMPVYDISVDKYNNFYVDAGVMLHNCYRYAYWATKNNINSGEPQNDNGKWIRNPDDRLGSGCKHILLVLSNNSWLIKVASVIKNYVKYMEKYYQKQYADIIYPAIYGKPYEEPVQIGMFDKGDELDSEEDTLDKSNEFGRTSTQFKKGNKQGLRFASKNDEIEGQEEIDLD